MFQFCPLQEQKAKEEEEKKRQEAEAEADKQEPEDPLSDELLDNFTKSMMTGMLHYSVLQ